MILDKHDNMKMYKGLSARLDKALELLESGELESRQDGRYEFEGDELYCLVLHYPTKPLDEGRLETHRKYIDVQYMVSGAELMGYTPLSDKLEVAEEYDPEKDFIFYEAPEEMSIIDLRERMFAVLFPDDAHMPGRHMDTPEDVFKIVFKVRVD